MERQSQRIAGRRFLLPDGSERYLVDEAFLSTRTAILGGQLIDPLKTTVVQNQRSMTTWVVRKGLPSTVRSSLRSNLGLNAECLYASVLSPSATWTRSPERERCRYSNGSIWPGCL